MGGMSLQQLFSNPMFLQMLFGMGAGSGSQWSNAFYPSFGALLAGTGAFTPQGAQQASPQGPGFGAGSAAGAPSSAVSPSSSIVPSAPASFAVPAAPNSLTGMQSFGAPIPTGMSMSPAASVFAASPSAGFSLGGPR